MYNSAFEKFLDLVPVRLPLYGIFFAPIQISLDLGSFNPNTLCTFVETIKN